jgi:hypothetical protein
MESALITIEIPAAGNSINSVRHSLPEAHSLACPGRTIS